MGRRRLFACLLFFLVFLRILASPVLTRGRWPIVETMNKIQRSGYVQRVGYVLLALDRDACETEVSLHEAPEP